MSQSANQRLNGAGSVPTPATPVPQPHPREAAHPNRQHAPALHAQPVEQSILENLAPVQDANAGLMQIRITCRVSFPSVSAAPQMQAHAQATQNLQNTVHVHTRKRTAYSASFSLPPQPKRLRSHLATAPEAVHERRSNRPNPQRGEQAGTSGVFRTYTSADSQSSTADHGHADLPPLFVINRAEQADDDEAMRSRLSGMLGLGFVIADESGANGYTLTLPRSDGNGVAVSFHVPADQLSQTHDPAEVIELIFAQAIERSRLDVADAMASKGSRPSAAQAGDAELVKRAVREGRPHLLRALMDAGADIKVLDGDGNSLLHLALLTDVSEAVQWLAVPAIINVVNRSGDTPLHLSIKRHRGLDRCMALLRKGPDMEILDGNGDTPLTCAIRLGKAAEMAALLRAGANPDATDGAGNTPLHLASRENNQIALLILIATSCDTRLRDRSGRTALEIVEQKIDVHESSAQEAEDEDVIDQENYDLLRYHTPTQEEEQQARAVAELGRNTH